MIRSASLITILLALALPAHSGDSSPPVGANCNLVSPPKDAGEKMNHGIVLRVFPRAKDITASYTGCQALLAPDADKWSVVLLTEIVAGDPIRVWSPDDSDLTEDNCRFKQGKVVEGNPDRCPMPEHLLIKSLAPGCVQIIRDAVAKHGSGTPRPQECDDQ